MKELVCDMTYRFAFVVFGVFAFCGALTGEQARAHDAYAALPPGPGRDVMISICSSCHSPERASTEKHDRAGWEDVIGAMQSKGATVSDSEFDEIAAYLAQAYPSEK
jgi:mono/diheme cytochrome c family protein